MVLRGWFKQEIPKQKNLLPELEKIKVMILPNELKITSEVTSNSAGPGCTQYACLIMVCSLKLFYIGSVF